MTGGASGSLDAAGLIGVFGFAGLLAIVFAECGLLIGFFLPGDSLLFASGLLIATGRFATPLPAVLIGAPIAATAGSIVGYHIGRTAGPALCRREDGRFLRPEHLHRAEDFFARRGPMAVISARFVPVVRTLITAVAGAARMDFRRYVACSAFVSVLWGAGLPIAGYWLGGVPIVAGHVETLVLTLAGVSAMPILFELTRARRRERQPV